MRSRIIYTLFLPVDHSERFTPNKHKWRQMAVKCLYEPHSLRVKRNTSIENQSIGRDKSTPFTLG